MFYGEERSSKHNVPSITKMKTKLLNLALAVFSVTALSSVSMANPAGSQTMTHHLTPSNAKTPTRPVLNNRCQADSCCAAKTVTDSITGGRTGNTTFKKVVTCGKTCSIEHQQQRAVCRKGMRA